MSSIPALVFDNNQLSSYNRQDRTKSAAILDGGLTLQLAGDTWKKYAYNYTITENTLLDFDFRSEPGADIQAIGFDTDDSYNRTVKEAFQIAGARPNSGYQTAFFNATGTEWQYFTLPVGQYFTGPVNFLTFTNDHVNTVANPEGAGVYQNIRLYERDLTDATAPLAALGATPAITETGYSYNFQVTYSDEAGIRLSSLGNDDIEITRPDGFRYFARLTNIEANPERTQVVATYTLTSNLGWGLATGDLNGQYQISLREGQIADFNGNLLGQQNLGALEVNVAVPPTAAPPETSVTFDPEQILSYNRQDLKGFATVLDGGKTLKLQGNTWKKYRYPYTITPDTILKFEYQSDGAGEEQAIGFDTDDVYSKLDFPAFQLYGAKAFSNVYNTDNFNYDGAGWKTYEIAVGEYFTGTVEYLTFINDQDIQTPTANSFFRNVQLFDRFELDAEAPTATVNPLADINTATGNPEYFFTVIYQDNKALNLNSLDSQDIRVIGPNGFSAGAEFVKATVVGDSVQALYRVLNPANWDSSQVGEYRLELQPEQVKDLSGNSAASVALGAFRVQFAPSLTLVPAALSNYGTQGRSQNAGILDGGNRLSLTGDTWQKYEVAYTVTPNTLLDFQFRSLVPGNIQAIGFDTDNSYQSAPKWGFQLGGDKPQSFRYFLDAFDSLGTDWRNVTLEAGKYFTGAFTYLTFANDHNITNPNGASEYRNIRLYERDLTDLTAPQASLLTPAPITETGFNYNFQVLYTDEAGIRLSSLGNGDIQITRPDGFRYLARLTNLTANADQTQVTAAYTATSNLGWGVPEADLNGNYLITLLANQVADLNGNTLGEQQLGAFIVAVAEPPQDVPIPPALTFDPGQIFSYNRQDLNGSAQVLEGGQTLELTGNTWKKYRYPYVVTPDTVLTFKYRSDRPGEEQSIGFDTDDLYGADFPAFQLSGLTAAAGYNTEFYRANAGEWQTYDIPLGQYFTGAVEYLTFINDHDVSAPDGNGFYSQIRLYDRLTSDQTAPTVQVNPLKNLYFATVAQPYRFTLTAQDNKGLDLESLSDLTFTVTGPQSFSAGASVIEVLPNPFNTEATVTVELSAPLPYSAATVGEYTIFAENGQIRDINGNSFNLGTIGSFEVSAPSSIGVNLSTVRSVSSALPFVDGFKSARAWIPQRKGAWDTGAALSLDENGWVTAWPDPAQPATTQISTLLFDNIQGRYPGGKYVVLYEGEGTLTYSRDAVKDNAASAPGRDVITVTPSNKGILLSITAINPENYIRDIRVVPLEAETTYEEEIFNSLYLDKIAPFSTLRFMDWGFTNNSPQVEWSDRSTPDRGTWMGKGVPVEIMVELANTTQSAPWFTLPHQATDDYIRNFATSVRDNLDPGLTVYVEYSNEVWNPRFDQYRWVRAQAQAEWPDSPLGEYTQVIDWYSRRTTQVTRIWDEVFGADKDRVIGVMAGRSADVGTLTRALSYAWAENPLTHAEYGIDALAIAPYFGNYLGNSNYESQVLSWTQQPDGGLDTLFAELNQGGQLVGAQQTGFLNGVRQQLQAHKDLAEAEALPWIAYEGGQSLVSAGGVNPNPQITDLFGAANRDPRMGQIYEQYLDLWNEMGGGLFVHFNDIGRSTGAGSWGSLESVLDSGSPKYDALVNFIGAAQASGFYS